MKSRSVINFSLLSTIGYCIYFSLLPFGIKYNNLGIIILIVTLLPKLLSDPASGKKSLCLYWRSNYPLLMYYLYLCFSFLIVMSLGADGQHLETRIGMIAIPLILSYLHTKDKREITLICLSFIIVITALSILGIVSYLHYYNLYGEVSTWIMAEIILVMHRPIWGLYLLGVMALAYYLAFQIGINRNLFLSLTILSLINFVFLILSQAKSSIVSLIAVVVFLFVYDMVQRKYLRTNLVWYIVVLGVAITVVVLGLYFQSNRYFFFLSESISISLDYRMAHWSCAFSSIKQFFVFGIGTGMEELILDQCYASKGREDLLGYNTHNQFLELILETGIIGLALISIWWIRLMGLSIKSTNKTLLMWLIVLFVSMLTENVFSTQKAILVLFSVLSVLLYTDKGTRQSTFTNH